MGYPSKGKEGLYRNPLAKVQQFFEQYHKGAFQVYNLCSERLYDPQLFDNRVQVYPFPDHNAPQLKTLYDCCESVAHFLESSPHNVVAIHCKAGKGRTGTVIACLLLHCGASQSAFAAISKFGAIRTHDGKGITIPSQKRYVEYYENCLHLGFPVEDAELMLKRIELSSTPHFDLDHGSDPYFLFYQHNDAYFRQLQQHNTCQDDQEDNAEGQPSENEEEEEVEDPKSEILILDSRTILKPKHIKPKDVNIEYEFPLKCKGDVKCVAYDKDQLSKDDKMFSFWFHTSMVNFHGKSNEASLTLYQHQLDKAIKDKKHKKFDEGFSITLHFEVIKPGKREKKPVTKASLGRFNE